MSTDLATRTDYDVSTQAMVFDPALLEGMSKIAELMASARISVPKHLVGAVGDCFAIVVQATQWRMNPYAIAQKTHVINGVLGYESQLVNAVISSSSLLAGRPNYEWFGPWERVIGKFATRKSPDGGGKEYRVPNWTLEDEVGCGVRVRATLRGESSPRELELLLSQARTRNSTLWADDPRQQLAYLAIKRWARLHAPDVLLGVYTPDELQEVERAMGPADVVESPATSTTAIKDKLAAKRAKPALDQAPDLDDVLSAIAGAESMTQLNAAGALAARLDNADDKATARKAFADRKAALKAPVEPPPLDLAEPAPLDQILDGIARSPADDLGIWLDEARVQQIDEAGMARVMAAIEERKA